MGLDNMDIRSWFNSTVIKYKLRYYANKRKAFIGNGVFKGYIYYVTRRNDEYYMIFNAISNRSVDPFIQMVLTESAFMAFYPEADFNEDLKDHLDSNPTSGFVRAYCSSTVGYTQDGNHSVVSVPSKWANVVYLTCPDTHVVYEIPYGYYQYLKGMFYEIDTVRKVLKNEQILSK